MKYILFIFTMALTLSFTINGCKKAQTITSPPELRAEQCTNPNSCPTRGERIVCDINTQTRAGKLKEDWIPMNSTVSNKRYYRLNMEGGSIFALKKYTSFYIYMSAGNATIIDIQTECAKELFKYLEIVKGFAIKDEKQKVTLDFLDAAERQFGTQQEE